MQRKTNAPGGLQPGTADKMMTRACEACRIRKIRCLQDRSFSDVYCKPCVFANRACVYPEPSLKKRRKRTDARVAELEKTVKALSTALHGSANGDSTIQGNLDATEDFLRGDLTIERPARSPSTLALNILPGISKAVRTYDTEAASSQWSSSGSWSIAPNESAAPRMIGNAQTAAQLDVVSRGLLSMAGASFLLNIFINELSPHFPNVTLSRTSTANDVRREKPMLFLAMITAASSTINRKLNALLTTELQQVFANRIFMKGDKSIELVQALLITTSWSFPSLKYDEAKFYQLIHVAATMALEMGLGKKISDFTHSTPPAPSDDMSLTGTRSFGVSWNSTPLSVPPLKHESGEGCRAIVTCYITCSGVSLSLCRPSMLRFSDWISDCVNMLECTWDAPLGDRRLAAWARIAHLMEEFQIAFAADDTNITVSLVEPRVQRMLRPFKDQLEKLRRGLVPEVMDQALEIYYYYCKLYMHVISMHLDYDVEDFQPPYWVKVAIEPSRPIDLPTTYIEALSTCSAAAQDLINTFLQTEIRALHHLPTVTYVRMTYAITVLVKLSVAATSSGSGTGKFVDCQGLQVTQHLKNLISHLSIAVGDRQNRVTTVFLAVVRRLKSWYLKENRVELCPSCHLINEECVSDVQGSPKNGSADCKTELEDAPTIISPTISVLSMQCIYTPSCSAISAAKADRQSALFSSEAIDITPQPLDNILGMNTVSTSYSDDFFNSTLAMDWSQLIPTNGNDLPAGESSSWVFDGMSTAV
ncbi:hypothetical protein MMC18_002943 [Xylographa bjoerkii]|nr:hypothetical protein [Xylographa bjoerkii]